MASTLLAFELGIADPEAFWRESYPDDMTRQEFEGLGEV
jgi:hypothetical protein